MATSFPILAPTSTISRDQSPWRRDQSPNNRHDSWRNSSNWRSNKNTPDQSPTRKSESSTFCNPLEDNNWRSGCTANGTADMKEMPSRSSGDFSRNSRSPTRHSASSSSVSSRDQSPSKRDIGPTRNKSPSKIAGVSRVAGNGTITGPFEHVNTPEYKAQEATREARIAEALQPTSPPMRHATAMKPQHQQQATSQTSNTTTAVNSDTSAAATATATTPKKNKKNSSNNNNDTQPSKQKNRKASRTPAANMVTPLKKQQFYAGPAFANSPAPSSLPIPKFFLRQEAEKASESPRSASASPALTNVANKPLSGLDMLFNAHREEQAKQQPTSTHTANPQYSHNASVMGSKYEDGKFVSLNEEQWRDYQSEQLKALVIGKPSTPQSRSPGPQHHHMSAPPQFATRTSGPSAISASPSDHDQRSDYYYGNRSLSPMFEAARQPTQVNSPSGMMDSFRPKHYREPNSQEQQAAWNRYPQYSPNPTKTAAYLPPMPSQNYAVPIPDSRPQTASATSSKAQKEDAIRKMIGMK